MLSRVTESVQENLEHGKDRKAWIVFCTGVEHATEVNALIQLAGIESCIITGKTPKAEREQLIVEYNTGKIKCLVNCNVLTEGFDSPAIDMVVLLRPTKSPGLYYQMVGRGLRLFNNKENCLVLDFGKNISRHGPIDSIKVKERLSAGEGEIPVKECPECGFEAVPAGCRNCPECDFEFEQNEKELTKKAASDKVISEPEEFIVESVQYTYHSNSNPEKPDSLRINYYGSYINISEWICPLHTGYAKRKAEKWWRFVLNSDEIPCPDDIHKIVEIGQKGLLLRPKKLLVDFNGKYPNILKHFYGVESKI